MSHCKIHIIFHSRVKSLLHNLWSWTLVCELNLNQPVEICSKMILNHFAALLYHLGVWCNVSLHLREGLKKRMEKSVKGGRGPIFHKERKLVKKTIKYLFSIMTPHSTVHWEGDNFAPKNVCVCWFYHCLKKTPLWVLGCS